MPLHHRCHGANSAAFCGCELVGHRAARNRTHTSASSRSHPQRKDQTVQHGELTPGWSIVLLYSRGRRLHAQLAPMTDLAHRRCRRCCQQLTPFFFLVFSSFFLPLIPSPCRRCFVVMSIPSFDRPPIHFVVARTVNTLPTEVLRQAR